MIRYGFCLTAAFLIVNLLPASAADGAEVELDGKKWSAELAGPDGQIATGRSEGDVVLSATGGTDMWGSRAGAPILMTDAPEGNFAIEAVVEYPSTSTHAVAGLCVYKGGKTAKPEFTFGLDHWTGNQKVKLQGLPPQSNNPGLENDLPGCRKVYLKLECCRKAKTCWSTDSYRGYYKLKADDKWKLSNVLDRDVANDKIGLFLKANAAQSATFSQVKITALPDKPERVKPVEGDSVIKLAKTTKKGPKAPNKRPAPPRVVQSPTKPDPSVLKNPQLTSHPIVFVTRAQYPGDHHNTATMFQTSEINEKKFRGPGAIKMIDFADGGKVTTILEVPDGIARDIEVSYDGKKILFAMRKNQQDDYHLYEINADGTGLKQLTFGSGISDIDPIYLPNDRILFSSTREPKYCMCNRHIMCNMFTMDGDGANIQQIGHSTLHEGHASVLSDGRIVYDRWEYVDRNFGDAQGVWSVNPDGTNHAVYWGNNTNSPGAVLDNRAVPDSDMFICTFSSCHDRPWGAIALIDRRLGMDLNTPVIRTWPPSAIDLVGKGNYDTFKRVNPKYEDPYPLNSREFLVSRQIGRGEQTGIYLIDLDGNETLLHTEAPGCYDPMPLRPRQRETVIPSRIDLTKSEGYFYIADAYVGTGMEKIDRGTVKYVRVVESPEKRFWTQPAWMGSGTQAPGMAFNDFNNKRIIGTTPVEEDGSAYFSVPADTFVYFQLLDENQMMIQSMRSGTIVRPGETAGCVGCHDNRRSTVPPMDRMAMKRDASPLKPWYGPPRLFSYLQEVQPALDKHCVSCHDYGKEAGKKLNLAGDLNSMFNMSYHELRTKGGLVKVPGAGPSRTMTPKSWGSHASKVAKVMLEGHGKPEIDKDIKLDKESFDRIVTWIDINAPYYPSYASAYRNNRYGRCPLNNQQVGQLGKLTGANVGNQGQAWMVSFTRPELSPCLQKLDKNGPKYKEALSIIQAGKEMLAKRPRADMAGFQLVEDIELQQEKKYQALLDQEIEMRAAIAAGEKKYEQQPQ